MRIIFINFKIYKIKYYVISKIITGFRLKYKYINNTIKPFLKNTEFDNIGFNVFINTVNFKVLK